MITEKHHTLSSRSSFSQYVSTSLSQCNPTSNKVKTQRWSNDTALICQVLQALYPPTDLPGYLRLGHKSLLDLLSFRLFQWAFYNEKFTFFDLQSKTISTACRPAGHVNLAGPLSACNYNATTENLPHHEFKKTKSILNLGIFLKSIHLSSAFREDL